jgi:CRISPR-associated endonuclease Csn1
VQAKKLFARTHRHGDVIYWNGGEDIARVKKTVAKNAVHLTRYAFFRKGGLFDQQPVKAAEGLVPLKKGLPTEQYGGYNKATASCFMLVRFTLKGKREVMLVPVELLVKDRVLEDREFAQAYLAKAVEKILGKQPEKLEQLLNGRFLKINTVFCFDGVKMALASKYDNSRVSWSPIVALTLSSEWEKYVKALEGFQNKREKNKNLLPNEAYDGISREKNLCLYKILAAKLGEWPFVQFPRNPQEILLKGIDLFAEQELVDQISCLLNIIQLMGPGSTGVDLKGCGSKGSAGKKVLSNKLSNWENSYSDVRIIDESASGLFSHSSENLLDLL